MKEEYNLFEITKTQAKLDVYRKKKQQKDTFQPKEIAIGSTNLENLQVANNGAFITFRLSDWASTLSRCNNLHSNLGFTT